MIRYNEKLKQALHEASETMLYPGSDYPVKAVPYARVLEALSVFERAHTPSDDEREALDYAIRCAIPTDLDYRPLWKLTRAVQDSVLAAGFRRSEGVATSPKGAGSSSKAEVPEPKIDPKPWIVRGYFGDYIGRAASVDPLTKGDHVFKPRPRYEQERAVYDAAEIELPEPQGEPSDAPTLPNDCDCEDREALVRPEGLVCGTCDKLIAPSVTEQGEIHYGGSDAALAGYPYAPCGARLIPSDTTDEADTTCKVCLNWATRYHSRRIATVKPEGAPDV